jgi:hypothetical protein
MIRKMRRISLLVCLGCGAPAPGLPDGAVPVVDAGLPGPDAAVDPAGVLEIYPTKEGGRVWCLDPLDPEGDGVFHASSATGTELAPAGDGSWRASDETDSRNSGTRLEVGTPTGETPWGDVEISGYVQLESSSFDEEFSWYGRSGHHTADDPCDGTAYHMQLTYGGDVWYQKEIWHTGGYTPIRRGELADVTAPLVGRWVGVKAMIYTDGGVVVNEIWVDGAADGTWRKVNGIVDDGGWAGSELGCERAIDQVLTDPRPIVAFRADNATFRFRQLCVREISAAP